MSTKRFFLQSIFLLLLTFTSYSHAVLLQEDPHYEYDVRFTNPLCASYVYDEEVYDHDGDLILQKPQNVWCSRADYEASVAQAHSPERKIIEWIRAPETREIFMAFLSFSNRVVVEELCAAVEERNVKLRLVMHDPGSNTSRIRRALELMECQPLSGLEEDAPELLLRGDHSGLDYAHNKLMIFNPEDLNSRSFIYGSANMSSGTVLHHENWHFVRASSNSHFAEIHDCLKEGLVGAAQEGRRQFMAFIRDCRAGIAAPEEEDIKVFIVPAEQNQARDTIMNLLEDSSHVEMAAHRFSWSALLNKLTERLGDEERPLRAQLILDDDMYWLGQADRAVGPNSFYEYHRLQGLIDQGLEVKYMQTNHGVKLLHHNKFMIFHGTSLDSDYVFTGAGNFTGTAFSTNLENYYLIKIPSVLKAFNDQYPHMWEHLATAYNDMPTRIVRPRRVDASEI